MPANTFRIYLVTILMLGLATVAVSAQSFRVQCPASTITHPTAGNNNSEPAYTVATSLTVGTHGYYVPSSTTVNGAIKCQQISGGDGYATMADGTQTYMFSFGPLSGLTDIANGKPGTQFPNVFNTLYVGPTLQPGDPATTGLTSFHYNGAVGLMPDPDNANAVDGHVDPRQVQRLPSKGTNKRCYPTSTLALTTSNAPSASIPR